MCNISKQYSCIAHTQNTYKIHTFAKHFVLPQHATMEHNPMAVENMVILAKTNVRFAVADMFVVCAGCFILRAYLI